MTSSPERGASARINLRLFKAGTESVLTYLGAQKDYNDVVRQYLETAVRHRRSGLRLNTALGQRIVP